VQEMECQATPAGQQDHLQANFTKIAGFITHAIYMDQAGAMAGTGCRTSVPAPSAHVAGG
jgi:hypothetical protein